MIPQRAHRAHRINFSLFYFAVFFEIKGQHQLRLRYLKIQHSYSVFSNPNNGLRCRLRLARRALRLCYDRPLRLRELLREP